MTDDLLKDFPVVIEQFVAWGDMDSYRHVNNVVYFRYFENARLEYFHRLEWESIEAATRIGPILQATQARFRRPVTHPDTLLVGARAKDIGVDRFTLEHIIVSKQQGVVTTLGESTIVTIDYSQGQKVAMPEELRRRIENLEASIRR